MMTEEQRQRLSAKAGQTNRTAGRASNSKKYCKYCGSAIDADSVVCSSCGRILGGSASVSRKQESFESDYDDEYRKRYGGNAGSVKKGVPVLIWVAMAVFFLAVILFCVLILAKPSEMTGSTALDAVSKWVDLLSGVAIVSWILRIGAAAFLIAFIVRLVLYFLKKKELDGADESLSRLERKLKRAKQKESVSADDIEDLQDEVDLTQQRYDRLANAADQHRRSYIQDIVVFVILVAALILLAIGTYLNAKNMVNYQNGYDPDVVQEQSSSRWGLS